LKGVDVQMPSLFGWLENLSVWRDLPYPLKGGLLRALKAGLATTVGILLALATGGLLFPTAWSPAVVIAVTMALQALDKFLRETEIEKENANTPLNDEIDLPGDFDPEDEVADNVPLDDPEEEVPPLENNV
jgi:hypothetical protein